MFFHVPSVQTYVRRWVFSSVLRSVDWLYFLLAFTSFDTSVFRLFDSSVGLAVFPSSGGSSGVFDGSTFTYFGISVGSIFTYVGKRV